MDIKTALDEAVRQLTAAEIETPRLDVLVLLEDATDKDRGWILAHPEFELHQETVESLQNMIERRAAHEPLAYIRNKAEFYGREFFVNSDVLVPRPESEDIITLLKNINPSSSNTTVIDIGTGSGCLAITAKLELPNSTVYAVDISNQALEVTRKNAKALNTEITPLAGNLLEPFMDDKTPLHGAILLCNLPYVPATYPINKAAGFEPGLALYGGTDGLDLYRVLFEQLRVEGVLQPSHIIAESMPSQHEALLNMAQEYDYELYAREGFILDLSYSPSSQALRAAASQQE